MSDKLNDPQAKKEASLKAAKAYLKDRGLFDLSGKERPFSYVNAASTDLKSRFERIRAAQEVERKNKVRKLR